MSNTKPTSSEHAMKATTKLAGNVIDDLKKENAELKRKYNQDTTAYIRAGAKAEALNAELKKALSAILGHIESGYLVRNTSKDHEPGWAMKQLPFLNDLGKAKKLTQ